MKSIQVILFAFFIALVFTSCDPGYYAEYHIDNQTSNDITIVKTILFSEVSDTSKISSGTQLMIHIENQIGYTSERYIEIFDTLPFDSLTITNSTGDLFTKDAVDAANWSTEYRDEGDIGIITLTITDNDF